MFRESINKVLHWNNQDLRLIMQRVVDEVIPDTELILMLSVIKARNEVLELLTNDPCGHDIPNVQQQGPQVVTPTPAFVAEVEDDNPEKEDADVKKAREQSRGFFG